jgi:large subunit ribosomal protein L13
MIYEQKSFRLKQEEVTRPWYVIDANDQILGRLATRIAILLTGKSDPRYTPGVDSGAFVVIVNAEKIQMTGQKWSQKVYRRHTKHPGNTKEVVAKDVLAKKPEFIIEKAVKRMLPKNKIALQMIKRLKVYSGSEHPHPAQKPIEIKV